jgi:DNA-binding CsgD family transcriptional regulator
MNREGGKLNLSPSEERIASMVIEGLSNHEIGQKLFVTEKTVKFHLTNIYAKLGVQSRAQLIVKYLKADKDDGEFIKLMRELINGKVGHE